MKSFTITTLGCKVNRYETEAILEQLVDQGWYPTNKMVEARLCIINTCTVTQKAAMQSRQAVRRAIRAHPAAVVVVTGCYAQIAPEVFAAMPGVNHVIGHTFKDQIAHLTTCYNAEAPPITLVEDLSASRPYQDLPISRFGSRTRPFLKIQDGCDAFCSYCVIPHARGRSRSLEPEVVLSRIRRLKKQGYTEVVLCGINIGRYGQDLTPATTLCNLIPLIKGCAGLQRWRLSSIEPTELSEGLIGQLATSKYFCPHLHIPLQSGDDEVLKGMNRPYRSKYYENLIHHIISMIPGIAIGVDVLVGFPGETERAFENTCNLVKRLPIAYLHVFPFSKQKDTAAETYGNRVPIEIIKKRSQYLRALGEAKGRDFYEKSVGSVCEVLIEGKRDRITGHLRGLTRNYIPVLLEGTDELLHQTVKIRLTRVENGRAFGEYLSGQ